ncbi:MAG: nucleotidyltransferase family protein [Proteobacteria bacterium]|nr:nucleotidyltransferase family protein [Pseudomonadota bacterium]
MERFEKIKGLLAMHGDVLRERFKVKELGVFGSYVRGEEKEASDIDVLVEFEEPVSLLGLVSLENHLSDLFGVNVDLVPKGEIRPELKEKIIKEVVYL